MKKAIAQTLDSNLPSVQSIMKVARPDIAWALIPPGHIPAVIEAGGAVWDGYVRAMTLAKATVVCHGLPPVSWHQRVSLSWKSPVGTIEFQATVERLSHQRRAAMVMTITFEFPELDEFTRYRLERAVLQDPAIRRRISLHACVEPLEQSTTVIEMGPNERSQNVRQRWAGLGESAPEGSVPRTFSDSRGAPSPLEVQTMSRHVSNTPVISRDVVIVNRHGARISAFWDAPEPLTSAPVVIMAPAYGETKRDSLNLAYFLAANGFQVVRYDHTDHVGESEGEHLLTTLSRMQDDLQDVVEWARRRFSGQPIALVATSLAARVALKASRAMNAMELLVLLNPVVDMRETLQAVHREDLLGDYLRGKPHGITNILGFNVDGRRWLADAHEHGYTDLATTIDDATHIRIPTVVFHSEHDVWVKQEAVRAMLAAFGDRLRSWFLLPHGLHRLVENPRLARSVYRQVVRHCRQALGDGRDDAPIMEPDRRQLGKQKRLERTRCRFSTIQADLGRFWSEYLAHFDFIANSFDYRQMLDHLVHLLGPLKSGSRLLDAGCGNGMLATFLLSHHRGRSRTPFSLPPSFVYVGLDFVPTALASARKQVAAMIERPVGSSGKGYPMRGNATATFLRSDLNAPLPFPDQAFDAVVSNLVLGYLNNPRKMVKECLRVLAPGGTLVMTNLKPNSDLSRIYCNFVEQADKPEEIDEARHLLSNAGKIREAEGDGLFRFPDEEELGALFRSASGGLPVRIVPTFANQAYLILLRKPAAANQPLQDGSRTEFAA